MRCGIVEENFHFVERALRGICLLCGDGAKGRKHGKVDYTGVVEESADDFLNECLVCFIEKGGVVLVGRVLFG